MITDGDWVCNRCGESRTVCSLCSGLPTNLIFVGKTVQQKQQELEAERELDRQSRSIAYSSFMRNSYIDR